MKMTISMKAGLFLLMPTLTAVALLVSFSGYLKTIEANVPYTNIAGRQRMLAERLHGFAYMVHAGQQEDRDELRKLIERFDRSQNILMKGGLVPESNAILPPAPTGVLPALKLAADRWSPLKRSLLLVANLPENEPQAQQAWEVVDVGMEALSEASNATVVAFVTHDMQLQDRIGLLLAANAIFTMLLFIGGLMVSLRTIVRPLKQLIDATTAMAGGDYSKRLEVHGRDELARLMTDFNGMAAAIGAAIDQERNLRQRQKAIIAAAINGLSRELTDVAVVKHVGKLAMEVVDVRFAMVSWLEDGEKQFIQIGIPDEIFAKLSETPPQGLGLLDLLWKKRKTVQVNDIASHPERHGFPKHHPPMTTMLGVPIEFGGEMIGVLYLCDRRDGEPFCPEDEATLCLLASACASALTNVRQFELLREAKERLDERARKINDANRLLRNHEIELQLMNDELRHANAVKNQFLANTSHELRTPLNAIIGFSDLLLTTRSEKIAIKQREYVEHINSAGRQLLTLINSLLDLSKIEAGILEINAEPTIPGVVLNFTVSQLRPLAEKKKVVLLVDIPQEQHAVYLDTSKLQQMWINLLGNAIKFTPEGGRIEAGFAVTDNESGYATMEGYVQDTGIGLESEDMERIFEPFVQAEGGLTREYGGTGLGLAVVRRLLEMQGGSIRVESTRGTGSRFIFTLPVQLVGTSDDAMVPLPPKDGPMAEEAVAPIRLVEEELSESDGLPLVLIIDDDGARAASIAGLLQEEGYQGEICELAHVEHTADEVCPFLIMVGLPDDPVDLYRRLHLLRSRKATRNIPLVLLGGHPGSLHFSLGTVDTVGKQMTRNDLVDMISRHGRHIPQADVLTVLVVDDEASVREYVREALRGHGYRILLAANGRDGLQAAIEHEPDLIILDLMMPGMSGFEVVEKLKRHPTACDIPVVVFTAKDLTREEVMRLGQEVEKVLEKGMTGRADLLRELRSLELLYPVRARLMDSVLRCYNPRYKQLRLAQECSRAERYGQQFSLAGWEMDDFDAYVRVHGRRWGVAALKAAVEFVNTTIRKGDVLVHSGEAAFTLILTGIEPAEAERVAEKIRLRVRSHRFPLPGVGIGHLTASFGCAHFGEDGVTPADLVTRMNARITQARRAGGDCCVSFEQAEEGQSGV